MEQQASLEIKTSTIIKTIALILGVFFLYIIRDVILVLFFAIMVSSAVNPFALWMEKRRVPRILSVLLLYIIFFGLMVFFLSLVVPIISAQINQLIDFLPDFVFEVSNALQGAQQASTSASGYANFFAELSGFLNKASQFLQVSSRSFLGFMISIFGGAVSFIAIIVISFYLAIMPKGTVEFIRSVLPDRYENYVIRLWKRSEKKVGRWLQGQILLALAVGLLIFIGLSVLGVKYAMVLALVAMVLELVPVAGPVIAAIPALFLAFSQSPGLALAVLILYAIVQQIESHLLTPVIMGRTLGLNPVTVIIALLIGAKVAGILGILIAVPVAVVVVEIFDDLVEQKESRRQQSEGK